MKYICLSNVLDCFQFAVDLIQESRVMEGGIFPESWLGGGGGDGCVHLSALYLVLSYHLSDTR